MLWLTVFQLSPAQAHLAGGQDITVDSYLIDFGYEPKEIYEGQKVLMSLNLVSADTKESQEFSHAWVQITREEKMIFSGNLHPQIMGNITLQTLLEKAGEHEISVQFYKEQRGLVQTVFPLTVKKLTDTREEATKFSTSPMIFIPFVVIVLLILTGLLFYKK